MAIATATISIGKIVEDISRGYEVEISANKHKHISNKMYESTKIIER